MFNLNGFSQNKYESINYRLCYTTLEINYNIPTSVLKMNVESEIVTISLG